MNQRMIVPMMATLAAACAGGPLRSPSGGVSPEYAQLQPQQDSFVVVSQGRPIGFQRTNLERTESGYLLHDEVRIQGLSQSTDVEFAMRGLRVEYGSDWVQSGSTSTTDRKTLRAIDAIMPPESVHDNLIATLVPALVWSPGSQYRITMRQSDSSNSASYTLTVMGSERVVVPSGTYETYAVELAGEGAEPVRLNVTTAKPHRVVRVAPIGQRVELVLASRAGAGSR